MELTFSDVLRRLGLWTLVCSVSAAPSFLWGMTDYNRLAMVTGVILFIAALTAMTCTRRFERLKRRPFIRRTLYIGYGTRMTLSVLFPLGMFLDLYPGLISIMVVKSAGLPEESYLGTLLITLVQGAFLNLIISVFMLLIWGFQRLAFKVPERGPACEGCGYDLRAHATGALCPECGRPVNADVWREAA